MKRIVLSGLVALGLILAVPAAEVFAGSPGPTTDVTGTVTNGSALVNDAKVTVVCNNVSKTTHTGSNGAYLVTYRASVCPSGYTATVEAVQGKLSGGNKGQVNEYGSADLNVAIVNVSVALPEFGLATGAVAGVAGVGALMYVRRRNLSGSKN